MNTADWINIARCNQQRMVNDSERVYTFKNTSKHDRFLEVYSTTRAALNLAQSKLNSFLVS